MANQMYYVKPIFDLDVIIETPTCMYSMPVIQYSGPTTSFECVKVAYNSCTFKSIALLPVSY